MCICWTNIITNCLLRFQVSCYADVCFGRQNRIQSIRHHCTSWYETIFFSFTFFSQTDSILLLPQNFLGPSFSFLLHMFLFCTRLFHFILFSLLHLSLRFLSFIFTGNRVSDEPQSLNLNPLKKWGGGSDIYRPIYKENIKREWKFESSWTRSQLRPCWRISTLTATCL